MKNVVITGGTRGLGFALAERFLEMGYSVTVSGLHNNSVQRAADNLAHAGQRVQCLQCDVTQHDNVSDLWKRAHEHWGLVDIWINNAGIVQPETEVWKVSDVDAKAVIATNLLGMIYGSQVASAGMIQQGHGTIFNMEGFGSGDEMRSGLTIYGTSKRALTYFSRALAKELRHTPIKVGLLSPGMVVTDLVKHPAGQGAEAPPRPEVMRIFNILGDTPETVSLFLAKRIAADPRTGTRISWLTPQKIVWRFLKSNFVRRDLFH